MPVLLHSLSLMYRNDANSLIVQHYQRCIKGVAVNEFNTTKMLEKFFLIVTKLARDWLPRPQDPQPYCQPFGLSLPLNFQAPKLKS